MYITWLIGAVIAFLILIRFKDDLIDLYVSQDELSRLNYEKYGDKLIFWALAISSLLWPVLLLILIFSLFDANS